MWRLNLAWILAAAGSLAAGSGTTAPTQRSLRRATVSGLHDDTTVRLKNGASSFAPFEAGARERPEVRLLPDWTATGEIDGAPGDERVALLSESSGGTGVRVYLAAFGTRDRKLENLGTALVGDRIQPRKLTIEGRAILLDGLESGFGDALCCPTRPIHRAYMLTPGGLRTFADVPFDLIHGQIVLRVAIGKIDGLHVLLDTGTDPSAIDFEAAARLGLPADIRKPSEAAGTGQDATTIYPSRIEGLRVGTELTPPIEAVAMDLSAVSRRLGVDLAGILGYSFLQGRIVEIDYPRRRVRLLPEPQAAPEGALDLPLRTTANDRTPLLEQLVTVDGKSLPVTLDTGSSLTLEVYPTARKLLGPSPWTGAGRVGRVVGARGNASVRHVEVGSMTIGRFLLPTRDLVLSDRPGGSAARMGNLGNGALGPFVLTLNYRDGRIAIAKP